jgi:hydrophobic/amphiphilic exporter-1 (mainly G- bacteria), HAE1 family
LPPWRRSRSAATLDDEHAWFDSHHHPIHPRPRHRCGLDRCPGGDQRRNLQSPPTYRKVNPADSPILLLAATSELLPLTEVDDNVETKLAQQIRQVPGVAHVSIGGQHKPAIRIQLDPAKLVAKGLSLEDVRVTTVDEPKGAIVSGARSFTIYTDYQLVRSKDWNDVIVAYRDGAPLRVSDIGRR